MTTLSRSWSASSSSSHHAGPSTSSVATSTAGSNDGGIGGLGKPILRVRCVPRSQRYLLLTFQRPTVAQTLGTRIANLSASSREGFVGKECFEVQGGAKLSGHVNISGAKNSALVVLAGALLCSDEVLLRMVPDLQVTSKLRVTLLLLIRPRTFTGHSSYEYFVGVCRRILCSAIRWYRID